MEAGWGLWQWCYFFHQWGCRSSTQERIPQCRVPLSSEQILPFPRRGRKQIKSNYALQITQISVNREHKLFSLSRTWLWCMSSSADRRALQKQTWPCTKQTRSPQEGAGQVDTGDRSFVFLKANQAASGHISSRAQGAGMDSDRGVRGLYPVTASLVQPVKILDFPRTRTSHFTNPWEERVLKNIMVLQRPDASSCCHHFVSHPLSYCLQYSTYCWTDFIQIRPIGLPGSFFLASVMWNGTISSKREWLSISPDSSPATGEREEEL